MKTYSKVRDLATAMAESKTKTERRKSATQLVQLLSQSEIRRKLAMEANPERRFRALSEMWRFFVQNSIYFVESFLKGKGGGRSSLQNLDPADLGIPKQILVECDRANEGIECPDPRFQMSKLSRKEIKNVIRFALALLQDSTFADEGNGDSPVDSDLQHKVLELLEYVCSQRFYVAFMKPEKEMKLVFESMEKILLNEHTSPRCSSLAGLAFASLLKTAANEMEFALHHVVPGCIKTVYNYIKFHKNSRELVFHDMNLIQGITTLMKHEPEQSIAPISRVGDSIFKAVKKLYEKSSASLVLCTCEDFFVAFLRIYQTAGILQGYHIGDPGYIGKRTLDQRVTQRLLVCVLEKALTDSRDSRRFECRFPLDEAMKVRLDLTARFLALCQRQFLCEFLWETMEDPADFLSEEIYRAVRESDLTFKRTPFHIQLTKDQEITRYLTSPFTQIVLRPLFNLNRGRGFEKCRSSSSGLSAIFDAWESFSEIPSEYPLMDLFTSVRVLLGALELFPVGSFLSSCICFKEMTEGCEEMSVPCCSPLDIAVVVHLLCDALEHHGRILADSIYLEWALLCLSRLCITTACQTGDSGDSEAETLRISWRRVWGLMFRSDLIFYPLMSKLSDVPVRRELFCLVGQIQYYGCLDFCSVTDSTMLRYSISKQSDVWDLPLFSDSTVSHPCSVFVMILAMISRSGLWLEGPDRLPSDPLGRRSRRWRLFRFLSRQLCLVEDENIGELITFCMCIVSHGSRAQVGVVSSNGLLFQSTWTTSCISSTPEFDLGLSRQSTCLPSDLCTQVPPCTNFLWKRTIDDPIGSTFQFSDLISQDPIYFCASSVFRKILELNWIPVGVERNEPTLNDSFNLETLLLEEASNLHGTSDSLTATVDENFTQYIRHMKALLVSCFSSIQIQDEPLDRSECRYVSIIESFLNSLLMRVKRGCGGNGNLIYQILGALATSPMDSSWRKMDIAGCFDPFYDVVVDVLESSYVSRKDTSKYSLSSSAENIDDLDFTDAKQFGKRTRREPLSASRKRQRVTEDDTHVIDFLFHVQSLLFIRPSKKTVDFVASLHPSIKKGRSDFSVDAPEALFILASIARFLCQYIPSNQVYEIHGESIQHRVCRFIRSIRDSSDLDSRTNLFGFDLCLSMLDPSLPCSSILETDIEGILELLIPTQAVDVKSLFLFPRKKWVQLAAGRYIFQNENSVLHELFDKDYPKHFVIGPLRDLSGICRRSALRSLASAFLVLPPEKVAGSVRNRFVRLMQSDIDEEQSPRTLFSSWCTDQGMLSGKESVGERQVWEDSFLSYSCTFLETLAILAKNVEAHRAKVDLLADSLELCSFGKFDMPFTCYLMMRKITGGVSIAELGSYPFTCCLWRWFEQSRKLRTFPTCALLPSLFSFIRDAGRGSCISELDGRSFGIDWTVVEQRVFEEVISKHIECTVAALIAFRIREGDSRDGIFQSSYALEIASVYSQEENLSDAVLSRLSHRALPHLVGFFAAIPALIPKNDKYDSLVQNVRAAFLFDGVNRDVRLIEALFILLDHLSSGPSSCYDEGSLQIDDLLEKISHVIGLPCNERTNGVLKLDVMSSLVEVVIVGSRQSVCRGEKFKSTTLVMKCFATIVVAKISSGDCQMWELDFFLRKYSRILLYTPPNRTTPALEQLGNILRALLSSGDRYTEFWVRLTGPVRYALAAVFSVHVYFQRKLLHHLRDTQENTKPRSSLLAPAISVDVVDREDSRLSSFFSCPDGAAFTASYDLFSELAESAQRYGLSSVHFTGIWHRFPSADDRNVLKNFSQVLCLQEVTHVSPFLTPGFIELQLDSCFVFDEELYDLDKIETEIIVNELSVIAEAPRINLDTSQFQRLFHLCESGFPRRIRNLAGRCIGQAKLPIQEPETCQMIREFNFSEKTSDPRSKFFPLLLRFLSSPALKVSEDTLAAFRFLSSIEQKENNNFFSRGYFKNFSSTTDANVSPSLIFNKTQIGNVYSILFVPNNWKEIWTGICRFDICEDKWICRLTACLSSWYFSDDTFPMQGCLFFRSCHEISAKYPQIASKLFPLLCEMLLREWNLDQNTDDSRQGSEETELVVKPKELLSFCFELVLSSSPSSGVRNLFLDTYDFLFQRSLDEFFKGCHKKNPTTLGKAMKLADVQGELEFQEIFHSRTKRLGPLDAMVPYRKALDVSTIVLARAYMAGRRFASCLFHLELQCGEQFYGILGSPIDDVGQENFAKLKLAEESLRELNGFHDAEIILGALGDSAFKSPESELARMSLRVASEVANALDDTLEGKVALTNRLASCGLSSILQTYIDGVYSNHGRSLSNHQSSILRERWDDSVLNNLVWSLENSSSELSPVQRTSTTHSQYPSDILSMLDAIQDNEKGSALGRKVEAARISYLDVAVNQISLQAPLTCLSTYCGVLKSFAVIDELVHGKTAVERVFRAWHPSPELFTLCDSDAQDFNHLTPGGEEVLPDNFREVILLAMTRRGNACPQTHQVMIKTPDILSSFLLNRIRWNCEVGRADDAEICLYRLKNHLQRNPSHALKAVCELEEARVLECRGDFKLAIKRAKKLVHRSSLMKTSESDASGDFTDIVGRAMVLCGKWQAFRKSEPTGNAIENYLLPATSMLKIDSPSETSGKEPIHRVELACDAWITLGKTAATMHDRIRNRADSVEWQSKKQTLMDRKRQLEECQTLLLEKKGDLALLERHKNFLSKEVNRIEEERSDLTRFLEKYGILAVESFLKFLSLSGYGESKEKLGVIYRLVSFWFDTMDKGSSVSSTEDPPLLGSLPDILLHGINVIQSSCFVPVARQLFSRLEGNQSDFQEVLKNLLGRMCREHPYHCIPLLVSLANGAKIDGASRAEASSFIKNIGTSKISVASDMLTLLKVENDGWIAATVESYQIIMDAYIVLALKQISAEQGVKRMPLSSVSTRRSEKLDSCIRDLKKKNSYLPAILTRSLPVRATSDYIDSNGDLRGGEFISDFESHFDLPEGGIHRPKVVVCRGSRGGSFKELVKGDDDTRNDAIMQQVFSFVNILLRNNTGHDTRGFPSGSLHIHTYKVVPFSPLCGVLEWVENTNAFGDFIRDKGSGKVKSGVGAPSRYFYGQLGERLCKELYVAVKDAPDHVRRKRYEAICRNFAPVYRFFFIENFGHSLDQWYQARTRYTRSVAVNSIVGHILGIGDRHTSNILVHQKTGVVIHIDFGICFEEGRFTLDVPELVPFRLTPNVIDGFGPIGVEGTFTVGCEAALRALRGNSNSLLVILSAVVADPMFKWNLSPLQARKRQQDRDSADTDNVDGQSGRTGKNEQAERVMARIREKLQGYEDGTSGEQQGIEGQVQLVINAARDSKNLCKMYYGWAPWI